MITVTIMMTTTTDDNGHGDVDHGGVQDDDADGDDHKPICDECNDHCDDDKQGRHAVHP